MGATDLGQAIARINGNVVSTAWEKLPGPLNKPPTHSDSLRVHSAPPSARGHLNSIQPGPELVPEADVVPDPRSALFGSLSMCGSCGGELCHRGCEKKCTCHLTSIWGIPKKPSALPAETSEATQLLFVQIEFCPETLQRVYEEESHVEHAFVWARMEDEAVVLIAVIIPSAKFWREHDDSPHQVSHNEQAMRAYLSAHVQKVEQEEPRRFGRNWARAARGMRVPKTIFTEKNVTLLLKFYHRKLKSCVQFVKAGKSTYPFMLNNVNHVCLF